MEPRWTSWNSVQVFRHCCVALLGRVLMTVAQHWHVDLPLIQLGISGIRRAAHVAAILPRTEMCAGVPCE